jgi:hypothetical protein
MTKLSIDIDNVEDAGACWCALRHAYLAIKRRHGGDDAKFIFFDAVHAPSDDRGQDFPVRWAIFIGLSSEDVRLAIEYYSMSHPNKQRLANELAKKNETLPPERRYGPRGTTSPMTMLKQINRVLKKKECDKIADLSADERHYALWAAENVMGRGQNIRRARHFSG